MRRSPLDTGRARGMKSAGGGCTAGTYTPREKIKASGKIGGGNCYRWWCHSDYRESEKLQCALGVGWEGSVYSEGCEELIRGILAGKKGGDRWRRRVIFDVTGGDMCLGFILLRILFSILKF